MRTDTSIVHLGRESAKEARAVNPPLVRASTVVSASLADYKAAYQTQVRKHCDRNGTHAAPDACWQRSGAYER